MSGSRATVVMVLDADRLSAATVQGGEGRARVTSWISKQVPKDVDPRDAEVFGKWLRSQLESAGMAGSRLVVAVPRGEVVLKRLKLPRPPGDEGVAESALAGMVKLQLTRHLTVAVEGTAIDFAPIATETPAAGPAMADVLAGALPGDRLRFLQSVAREARMKLHKVRLRAAGAAELLAEVSRVKGKAVMGIVVGWASIEFVVVDQGRLVFARAGGFGLATPAAPGEDETEGAFARRVAVEAKRTWMSYRVGQDSAQVEAVVVVGEGPLAAEVGQRCGAALELPWEHAAWPESVTFPRTMTEHDRLVAAPLIALAEGHEAMLDFANPRKPPDPGAARRQRILAAALGLIVICGVSYVVGAERLSGLRWQAAEKEEERATLLAAYEKYLLKDARLKHIEHWNGAGVDWLAHMRWLSDQMPDPSVAQLDAFTGELGAAVVFEPKDPRRPAYTGGVWRTDQRAEFSLGGRVETRELANDLRARLVNAKFYIVKSRGPDVEKRFDFVVQTSSALPVEPAAPGKGGGS